MKWITRLLFDARLLSSSGRQRVSAQKNEKIFYQSLALVILGNILGCWRMEARFSTMKASSPIPTCRRPRCLVRVFFLKDSSSLARTR